MKNGTRCAVWRGINITHTTESKHLNILAVDDEAGSRSALGFVLSLAGHHTVFAKDGDEALELFEEAEAPLDLIITDHQMERVSGLDLVRGLRNKRFTGNIIVLTAYAGTIEEEEYKKLEVAGIMEKPFDLAELRGWLDRIHGNRASAADEEEAPRAPKDIDFLWLEHD